jgi:putative phage-type endonuclease
VSSDDVVDAEVLVTPTGYELSPAEPESDEWFAQRRGGITATDIPKILGLSKYGNALSVYLDKLGQLPDDEAGEAARWGHLLEPLVATEYATRTGHAVHTVGTVAHVEEPWMRASLDRLVFTWVAGEDARGYSDDPAGALEVKTRSSYANASWRQDVPDDVLAQVVWQLLVTGLPWVDVAVLLGGQKLVVHRVTLDDPGIQEVAALCRREAERVWQHVLDETTPQVPADDVLLDLLDRMYPNRKGQRELSPTSTEFAQEMLAQYATGRSRERLGKAEATSAKAALVQLLDDGDTAIDDEGNVLFTYKPITRAGFTVAPTTYRQIKPTRKKAQK